MGERVRKVLSWRRGLFGVGLVFVIAVLGLSVSSTVRADEGATNELPDTSITVSPAKTLLQLERGTKHTGSFTIINTGAKSFTFELAVSPYSVNDQKYESNLEKETARTQISRWVSFDKKKYHLESGEEAKVTYYVDVPEDVPDGGQYAVILAQTAGQQSEGASINTLQRVGMLVFARMDGDTREEGKLESQYIKRFYLSPPVVATSLVENTGNVDFNAVYRMRVESLFGKQLYEDSKDFSVLPETRRAVEMIWADAPKLGIFKVTQDVIILNETFTITKTVFVVPFFVIIVLAILLLLVIILIVAKVKRSKNKRSRRGK